MPVRPLDYRRVLSWKPNETQVQRAQIGSWSRGAEEKLVGLGLLRVGYVGDQLGWPVELRFQTSDGGTWWGSEAVPIDTPCAIVLEEPLTVWAKPTAGLQGTPEIDLCVALSPVAAPSDRLYATRTVAATLNQVIVLPQWVRGVAVLTPALFQFRDRAGATLCTPLAGAHDRPAMAADLIVTTAGTIVLYY